MDFGTDSKPVEMETETEDRNAENSSYTYWMRKPTGEAVPIPAPLKLTEEDVSRASQRRPLGSKWNEAGTWEERNLNSWAIERIKEMLGLLEPVEYADGSARVTEVVSCSGEATVITVRNKKRVGYTFDITLGFQGSLLFDEFKGLEGTLLLKEASFGELDDLQLKVEFTKDEGLPGEEKARLTKELNSFLPAIREKLRSFEQELRDR